MFHAARQAELCKLVWTGKTPPRCSEPWPSVLVYR